MEQTERRVPKGERVEAGEKLVSLFEEHTAIVARGKAGKKTEFGRKVWLEEVEGGIVAATASSRLPLGREAAAADSGEPPEAVRAPAVAGGADEVLRGERTIRPKHGRTASGAQEPREIGRRGRSDRGRHADKAAESVLQIEAIVRKRATVWKFCATQPPVCSPPPYSISSPARNSAASVAPLDDPRYVLLRRDPPKPLRQIFRD